MIDVLDQKIRPESVETKGYLFTFSDGIFFFFCWHVWSSVTVYWWDGELAFLFFCWITSNTLFDTLGCINLSIPVLWSKNNYFFFIVHGILQKELCVVWRMNLWVHWNLWRAIILHSLFQKLLTLCIELGSFAIAKLHL